METHCLERKEHCDHRFSDMRKLMCVQFTAMEKAVTIAKAELDKEVALARQELGRWMLEHNDFRAQLTTQAATLMDVKTYAADHHVILKEIEILREWKAQTEGAKGWSNILAALAVLISMAVGTLHFFATMKG